MFAPLSIFGHKGNVVKIDENKKNEKTLEKSSFSICETKSKKFVESKSIFDKVHRRVVFRLDQSARRTVSVAALELLFIHRLSFSSLLLSSLVRVSLVLSTFLKFQPKSTSTKKREKNF